MKILFLLFSIVILQGCWYQKVDITDIKKAQQFCKSRGGVKYIRIDWEMTEVVFCINGEDKRLGSVKLQGEIK